MYKDVFCFKIGMFSVKNNLGWVMNRTDNLYSCVGRWGHFKAIQMNFLLHCCLSYKCLFLWGVDIYHFILKQTIHHFVTFSKFCLKPSQIPTCIIPEFIHCILLQNWKLGIINIIVPLSPLMWASCWLAWPSFSVIPPSILMPRFKENMGNGYKNTRNLQSNIFQINHPICTQASKI